MQPFRTLTALAMPLDRANVDTDQIIPKQFLKRIERTGYGDFLCIPGRQTPDGAPAKEFVLNDPAITETRIFSSPAKTSAAGQVASMQRGG